MTEHRERECRDLLVFLERVTRRLVEDLAEASLRTPSYVSSKPYIDRAYRLARSGLEALVEALREGCH